MAQVVKVKKSVSSSSNKDDGIAFQLRKVIIPGTTGGLYTLVPGVMMIFAGTAVYIYAYFKDNIAPFNGFDVIMYTGAGLLGIHTARATIQGKTNADVAIHSAEQLEAGEEIQVQSGDSPSVSSDDDPKGDNTNDNYVKLSDR